MTRYIITKDEWTPDAMDCDHPLCDPLHKQWHVKTGAYKDQWYCDKPAAPRVCWQVIDTTTGNVADLGDHETEYARKKDAVAALNFYLHIQERRAKEASK
jgi:hypothetical protein